MKWLAHNIIFALFCVLVLLVAVILDFICWLFGHPIDFRGELEGNMIYVIRH